MYVQHEEKRRARLDTVRTIGRQMHPRVGPCLDGVVAHGKDGLSSDDVNQRGARRGVFGKCIVLVQREEVRLRSVARVVQNITLDARLPVLEQRFSPDLEI